MLTKDDVIHKLELALETMQRKIQELQSANEELAAMAETATAELQKEKKKVQIDLLNSVYFKLSS